MEENSSVNEPRRISDADNQSPTRFGVSGQHLPWLSAVYGFIVSITIVVAAGSFIIWAYVPDYWLHSVGISYHPSRYWALPAPTYVIVTIVLAIVLYTGLNFLATPPPTSLKSMFDELDEDLLDNIAPAYINEQAIESISDIGINQVNEMYNDLQ